MDETIEQEIKERKLFSSLIRHYASPSHAAVAIIGAFQDLDASTNSHLFNSEQFDAASLITKKVRCLLTFVYFRS